jgi:hypothetical protein
VRQGRSRRYRYGATQGSAVLGGTAVGVVAGDVLVAGGNLVVAEDALVPAGNLVAAGAAKVNVTVMNFVDQT